ncbi:TRAP transporter small permease [Rhodobium gokarnense]|uniref:TRAP transporter small permease protein n=1 Tax=Rhodobium gokarnense TaxID=364296 RepID=A0ABT3HGZ4_9HYPH|nr:TRAP transporter small permease [Rhodobium gokarnense]MCW2309668.1 TRAP-type C4-dicarboxylate transport system permease small subunit [Rhodobium gokarnense]
MRLTRLFSLLDRFEEVVANLALASLVLILAAQVFFRYVLQTGITWSEEVSRFCFVWFVYISASLAAQKGRHIRVTVATPLIPGGERVALLLADAIWAAFNLFVVVAGILLIRRMIAHPVYSTALFLPLVYVYAVIPLAHALMTLRVVQRQWEAWRRGGSVLVEEVEIDRGKDGAP